MSEDKIITKVLCKNLQYFYGGDFALVLHATPFKIPADMKLLVEESPFRGSSAIVKEGQTGLLLLFQYHQNDQELAAKVELYLTGYIDAVRDYINMCAL